MWTRSSNRLKSNTCRGIRDQKGFVLCLQIAAIKMEGCVETKVDCRLEREWAFTRGLDSGLNRGYQYSVIDVSARV